MPLPHREASCVDGVLMVAPAHDIGHPLDRSFSHLASADHGLHWTPVGRRGTTPRHDGERWWSIGPGSITLWP